MTPTIRAAGERLRVAEAIKNLRGLLAGLESCVADDLPTTSSAQSVAEASIRLATTCARLDAYDTTRRDQL